MLIADIADGSVRDGLSLLDQAILIADGAEISGALISKMLRLNEQEQIYHLLDAIFQGDFPTAQATIHALYEKGGEPEAIIRDLLSGCFWLTRFHLTPALKDDLSLSDLIRKQASDMAAKMDIQRLTRAWQILQQGASEISHSPVKLQSLEMLAVKLCYASNLPDPTSLIQRFEAEGAPPAPSAPMAEAIEKQAADNVIASETVTEAETETETETEKKTLEPKPIATPVEIKLAQNAEPIKPVDENENPLAIIADSHEPNNSQIQDLQALKQLAEQHHEARLAFILGEQIIAVQFTPPNVTFHALHDLPDGFHHNLLKFIHKTTGENWQINWQTQNLKGY